MPLLHRYLLLILGLALTAPLAAQRLHYGLSAGLNQARLVTNRSLDTSRFKSFTSPTLGLSLNVEISPSWSFQSGLQYTRNGGRLVTIDDSLLIRERNSYHYLQLPVMMQYMHKDFIFVRTGAYFGLLTNAYRVKRSGLIDEGGSWENPTRERTAFNDLRAEFFPVDAGLWLALGMQFASGYNLEFRFTRSFRPVQRNESLYNSVVALSLNYLINYAEKGSIFFEKAARHVIYAELGGAAFGASFNYEYVFYQHPNARFAARIGLGFSPFTDPAMTSPLGLVLISGRKNHHMELGFSNNTLLDDKGFSFMGMGQMGYRFQKPEGGLFFKVSYTPYLTNYDFKNYNHWGGVSMGWAFKGKKVDVLAE